VRGETRPVREIVLQESATENVPSHHLDRQSYDLSSGGERAVQGGTKEAALPHVVKEYG
jgi:hypothetical protein